MVRRFSQSSLEILSVEILVKVQLNNLFKTSNKKIASDMLVLPQIVWLHNNYELMCAKFVLIARNIIFGKKENLLPPLGRVGSLDCIIEKASTNSSLDSVWITLVPIWRYLLKSS